VRGDSRRDLYSKALALCGLGVLAGAGALVDYWPVGLRFPLAASPAVASPAGASLTPSDADALSVLAGLLDAPRQSAVAATGADTLAEPPVLLVSYESLPTTDAGFDIGTPVEIESLPAPAFVNVRNEVPILPGSPVQLTAPAIAHGADEDFTRAASGGHGGFITSAFRRTGASIVRTGVKTGSSLVDAVRVVGGVVRRALPD
jgi:hypothetical protein